MSDAQTPTAASIRADLLKHRRTDAPGVATAFLDMPVPTWPADIPSSNGHDEYGRDAADQAIAAAQQRVDEQDQAEESSLFRRWTPAELLAAPRTFEWQVRGLMIRPTYGMVGGAQKTLKSYVQTFVDIGIASGQPIFDRFTVDTPTPVISYIGEGGRVPYTRRLERIAAAMGVDAAAIPLHVTFDTAPVQSLVFQESLRRDLEELQPGQVTIDPWYAYHGAKADARNLHEEGALLNMLSGPCMEAGACLSVVNHFNKTGSGSGLSRITMSGGAEWCDSWWLLSHRADPDVTNGRFQLLLEIGSRQWGGSEWDLDLNVGRFDVDLGEFDGDITWHIARHDGAAGADELEQRILDTVAAQPYRHTQTDLEKLIGGRAKDTRATIRRLIETHRITTMEATGTGRDGRTTHPIVIGPASTPGQPRTEEANQ